MPKFAPEFTAIMAKAIAAAPLIPAIEIKRFCLNFVLKTFQRVINISKLRDQTTIPIGRKVQFEPGL